jgi:hypothetical protein
LHNAFKNVKELLAVILNFPQAQHTQGEQLGLFAIGPNDAVTQQVGTRINAQYDAPFAHDTKMQKGPQNAGKKPEICPSKLEN